MDEQLLRKLLARFKEGAISPEDFLRELKLQPYENLHFARLDYHRKFRIGLPEVIFCQGKSESQIEQIISRMQDDDHPVLATRVEEQIGQKLEQKFKSGQYNNVARTFRIGQLAKAKTDDPNAVSVISAGTSDLPVAEEARETLDFLGIHAVSVYDVGVAGLHRFLGEESKLVDSKVLIVVAGMEGALASVVGGLSGRPIVAVPTSVGYGTSFAGLAPLLSMLNACSSGVTVVNIDNGYGAACAAFRIIKTIRDSNESTDL